MTTKQLKNIQNKIGELQLSINISDKPTEGQRADIVKDILSVIINLKRLELTLNNN